MINYQDVLDIDKGYIIKTIENKKTILEEKFLKYVLDLIDTVEDVQRRSFIEENLASYVYEIEDLFFNFGFKIKEFIEDI